MKHNALKTRPWTATQTYPYPEEPPPPLERSLGGKMLRGLLMMLFGTWMFALGFFVGRETVPIDFEINPLEKEFVALKAEEKAEDQKQLQEGVDSLRDTDLDFYEELRNGSSQGPDAIIPFVNPAKPVETKRPLAKKPPASQRNEPPATASEKPESRPKPAPKPPPPAKATGGETGNFAIQVASFGNPMDAERLVDRLRENGYPSAYQTNEDVPGVGVRFRVKVGYFTGKPIAERVLKQLVKEENLVDAYIFQRK